MDYKLTAEYIAKQPIPAELATPAYYMAEGTHYTVYCHATTGDEYWFEIDADDAKRAEVCARWLAATDYGHTLTEVEADDWEDAPAWAYQLSERIACGSGGE